MFAKKSGIQTITQDTGKNLQGTQISDTGKFYQNVLFKGPTSGINLTTPYKKYGEDALPLFDGFALDDLNLLALSASDVKLIALEGKRTLQVYWLYNESMAKELHNSCSNVLFLFVVFYSPTDASKTFYKPVKLNTVAITADQFKTTGIRLPDSSDTVVKTTVGTETFGITGDFLELNTYGFDKAQLFLMFPEPSSAAITVTTGKQRLYYATR